MVKLPTLLLGTTLGIAALGLSATASAGVAVGVGIDLPVPAPVVAAVPEPVAYAPEAVAYMPGHYYGPHFYAGVPYYHAYFGPAYVRPRVPVGVWHPGFVARGGYHWRR
jgi:hypothetical protein